VVAYCNAVASAQLAATYPTSGGTYVYGRQQLGEWWGFLAGWGFVVGKTASCAAMALTVAAYVAPPPWQRPVAVAAVVVLAAVNYHGVTRTAGLTRVIVTVVLAVLAVAVGACWSGGPAHAGALGRRAGSGWYGVLQSAGRCSSRSPATPGSRPWGRRSRSPGAPSRGPWWSRWRSPCSSTRSWG
jgi:APA family basic amino acid/polyamine antiporter